MNKRRKEGRHGNLGWEQKTYFTWHPGFSCELRSALHTFLNCIYTQDFSFWFRSSDVADQDSVLFCFFWTLILSDHRFELLRLGDSVNKWRLPARWSKAAKCERCSSRPGPCLDDAAAHYSTWTQQCLLTFIVRVLRRQWARARVRYSRNHNIPSSAGILIMQSQSFSLNHSAATRNAKTCQTAMFNEQI